MSWPQIKADALLSELFDQGTLAECLSEVELADVLADMVMDKWATSEGEGD